MKTPLISTLAWAALLGATGLAQEPTNPPPPRPPEAGAEPREPAPPRPLLPPGANRERPPFEGGRDFDPSSPGGRPERLPFPPPRDGDRRGPEGGARGVFRGGDRHESFEVERPKKPTPYLGVITSPVPPPLGIQLGLSEGFGLVVDDVVPDSPATTAGVQRYDVLKQFNDQQLLDPSQLATLVRSQGKDVQATLTVIRRGQEQKLTVKIGEKMLPERSSPDEKRDFFIFRGQDPTQGRMETRRRSPDGYGPSGPIDPTSRLREFQEKVRQYQDSIRKFEEQMRQWQEKREGEPPKLPPTPAFNPPTSQNDVTTPPTDILRELQPGAKTQVRNEWHDGNTRWDASRARVRLKDQEGEVELGVKDGHRTLTARNTNGDTIFSGAVDTPEQRDAVPEPFKGKLRSLEVPPPDHFAPPPRLSSEESSPRSVQ